MRRWEAGGLEVARSKREVVQGRICGSLHLLDPGRLEASMMVGGSSCC